MNYSHPVPVKTVGQPMNRLKFPPGSEVSALYSQWGLGLFIEPLGQNTTLRSCSLGEHCPSSEQNKAKNLLGKICEHISET